MLAINPYIAARNTSTYRLGVHPSTLASNYLCQVPRPKSTGSFVFAILMTDLVLQRGLWSLFKLIIDAVLVRRHPEMKVCEGCLKNAGDTRLDVGRELEFEVKGGYKVVERTEEVSSQA